MNTLRLLSFIALGGLVFSSVSQAEMRDFTNAAGNVIRAELVSHKGGKATLRRADGKEFEVAPSVFSPEDQAFIKAWITDTPASVSYRFEISADKKKVAGDTKNMGYKLVKNEKWSFTVAVKNISRDSASNLTIKYRVFYSNAADGSYSASSSELANLRMTESEVKLSEELPYNRTLEFNTTPVQIDTVDYDGAGSRYKDELKGCLIRVVDAKGSVVADWVSPQTSMKSKNWANTEPPAPRTARGPGKGKGKGKGETTSGTGGGTVTVE
jgi:hypothetical protein